MPYIVKSSLDIDNKKVLANDVEMNKLIEEKERYIKELEENNKTLVDTIKRKDNEIEDMKKTQEKSRSIKVKEK